jgi:hypothetical protein
MKGETRFNRQEKRKREKRTCDGRQIMQRDDKNINQNKIKIKP